MSRFLLLMILMNLFFLVLMALPEKDLSLERAKIAYDNENYEEAKLILEELVDEDDENAEVQFLLGSTYLMMKDYESAIDHLEEAVELNDENPLYHVRYARAITFIINDVNPFRQMSLAGDMKYSYQRAVELDPEDIEARVGLANFYAQAPGIAGGDDKIARYHARWLIERGEVNGNFVMLRIYQKEERADSALLVCKALENSLGMDPKYYGFYNTYGYLLLSLDRPEEAVEKFKIQVELAPAKANPYDSLGDGYLAVGNKKSAMENYRKALEIDPEMESSREKLEKLEKKSGD